MNKIIVCLTCLCCHAHGLMGCEVEKHTCEKEKSVLLQKKLDTSLEEFVQELLKIQKPTELLTTSEEYSRRLAWLQERIDEAQDTKSTKLARFNGNKLFYQRHLVNTMNARLMGIFEERRDSTIHAVPLERVAEINAQILASIKQ